MYAIRSYYAKTFLAEAFWILSGEQKIDTLNKFTKIWNMFAINGEIKNSYGHRLRSGFDRDQLVEGVNMLKMDNSNRQCYISYWDPRVVV